METRASEKRINLRRAFVISQSPEVSVRSVFCGYPKMLLYQSDWSIARAVSVASVSLGVSSNSNETPRILFSSSLDFRDSTDNKWVGSSENVTGASTFGGGPKSLRFDSFRPITAREGQQIPSVSAAGRPRKLGSRLRSFLRPLRAQTTFFCLFSGFFFSWSCARTWPSFEIRKCEFWRIAHRPEKRIEFLVF